MFRNLLVNIIANLNKLYFKKSSLIKEEVLCKNVTIIEQVNTKPFTHISKQYLPTQVKDSFSEYETWNKVSYFYLLDYPTIIEPIFGWSIFNNRYVIIESVYSFNHHLEIPLPSVVKFYNTDKRIIKIDCGLTLKLGWFNYWHYFNDILGLLLLVKKRGLLKPGVKVIIPIGLYQMPFFKQTLELAPDLNTIDWLPQGEKTFIQANSFIFCRSLDNHNEQFDEIVNLFQKYLIKKSTPPKIFLTRRNTNQRNLKNIDEIEALVEHYGFTVVNAEKLSLKEQIEIFHNTCHIIGIHGAALTNIIFRKSKPLKILEIFSENNIPPNFFWLSNAYNFQYNAIVGTCEIDGTFYLNPAALQQYFDSEKIEG